MLHTTPIMDHIGRKVVFLVTVLICVLFGTSALYVTTPMAFIVLWFMKHLMHPACMLAMIRYVAQRRERCYCLAAAVQLLGRMMALLRMM